MPHGSDPHRRPDQQSPDSGSSVPPTWWAALSKDELPEEGPEEPSERDGSARLREVGGRRGVPAVLLAVVGAVVAAGFSYLMVAGALAAAVAAGLVVATVLHQKLPPEPRTPNWWR